MLILPNNLFANAVKQTPTQFRITVTQVRLYNQNTASWVTVSQNAQSFDIATGSGAGALVGGYANGAGIPEGTYTQVEITISTSIDITAAYVDTNGNNFGGGVTTTYYTTSTSVNGTITTNNTGPAASGTAVIPAGTPGVIGDSFVSTQNLSPLIVVEKGLTKGIRIKFNLTSAATFGDDTGQVVCYPTPPPIVSYQQI